MGKTIHKDELSKHGSKHEAEGERLLLKHNVDPRIAAICAKHTSWEKIDLSLEELIVSLSDNLWKGKRAEKLENMVIDKVAGLLKRDRWDLFIEMDNFFEEIASHGPERLMKSSF